MSINGFINVLKPPGMTSHDVVSCLRRIYGTKKIGHAGTLDPAAAGVLPVAVGNATRLLEYMGNTDKRYRAEVLLGLSTDTDDDTGNILERTLFTMPPQEKITTALLGFYGDIMQTPSVYSAIKINGRKACDLARSHIDVVIPPRSIHIYELVLRQIFTDKFCIDVHCSKGTYIRSLCVDIGKSLEIPATMGFLIRTAVGSFSLADSHTLEEIANNPLQSLQGVNILLNYIPGCAVDELAIANFRQGKKIKHDGSQKDGMAVLVYNDVDFAGIGIISENGQYIAPHKVLN